MLFRNACGWRLARWKQGAVAYPRSSIGAVAWSGRLRDLVDYPNICNIWQFSTFWRVIVYGPGTRLSSAVRQTKCLPSRGGLWFSVVVIVVVAGLLLYPCERTMY